MKRCAVLVALVGVLILVAVSVVDAQQTPQPVVRLGNWLEVGNEVFMHILGAADVRYRTVHNNDFDGKVRDRTSARDPGSTATHEGDFDDRTRSYVLAPSSAIRRTCRCTSCSNIKQCLTGA